MPDEQTTAMLAELDDKTSKLEKVAAELSDCIEPFTFGFNSKSLMDNIKLYSAIEYVASVAKELSRIANVVEPVVAARIIKRMTQEDIETIKFAGYTYSPSEKTFVNVTAANHDSVRNWLKTHEEGAALVKETFNANALTSFVKGQLEAGKEVSKDISVYSEATLARRKVKG